MVWIELGPDWGKPLAGCSRDDLDQARCYAASLVADALDNLAFYTQLLEVSDGGAVDQPENRGQTHA